MQKGFQRISIPKLPVFSTEEGIKQIENNYSNIKDWKNIEDLVPEYYLKNKKLKRTGLVGIFAASLELTKQGAVNIMQKKIFDKLLIKKMTK